MFRNSILQSATVDLPQTLPRTASLRALGRLARWIPLPRTWREYMLWTLAMVLVTGLVALQIWFSLRIAEARQTLVAVRAEYMIIEQENAQLLWQISQYMSLERIQIEAARMGYAPSMKRDYRWTSGLDNARPDWADSAATSPALPVAPDSQAGAVPQQAVTHEMGASWPVVDAWWQPYRAALQETWSQWMEEWFNW